MYSPFISKDRAVKAFIQRRKRGTSEVEAIALFNQEYSIEIVDFPYEIFVEDDQYSINDIEKEIFLSLGPNEGECVIDSMDLFCPVIHKNLIKKTQNLSKQEKKKLFESNQYEEEHYHTGNWKSLWIAKTGYDYGINAFVFKHEYDRDCAYSIIQLGLNCPVL